MLVVLLVFSLLVLTLARAVPAWKTQIQRERENRMIDHAREYRMAIQRYFHKYGRYPPSLEVLAQKDGQGLRYLRQVWPDPLNSKGDGKWQVLHYGQAVTAEIVDQPPAAAQGARASGIAGPNLTASATTPGQAGPGGAAMGGALGGALGAIVGATMGATLGMPGGMPGGVGGAAPAPGLASGVGAGPTSGPGAGIGGGPVIGVASLSKAPAVHAFNGFDTPNDWQFVYNFAMDPSLRAGVPAAPTNGLTPGATPVPGMGPMQPPASGGGRGGN